MSGIESDQALKIRAAVGGVLVRASNYPDRVAIRMLGQDMGPLIDKVTSAVTEALNGKQP